MENKAILHRQRVIYLPTFLVGNCRSLGPHYGDTWYYKLQQAILEYLATRQDYYFIWKGLVESDGSHNPIPQWIKDRGFDNIGIETHKPFQKFLMTADKVICDYPSTGFYEAAVAGVPAMALCYRAFSLRETAREVFGEMLQDFATYDEAVVHIKNFLDTNPGLLQINIIGPQAEFCIRLLVEEQRMGNGGHSVVEFSNKPLLVFSIIFVIITEVFYILPMIVIDGILARQRAKRMMVATVKDREE